MQAQFQALYYTIDNSFDNPPMHLLNAIRRLPPVGALPAPPATWLMLALFEYRQRQQWAKQFVGKHMPEAIPPSKRLFQLWDRDPPVELDLPGTSEWKIALECPYNWGNLIHRTTGEVITFGLTEEDREVILFLDDFRNRIKPASRWEPAGRVLELNSSTGGIWESIGDLVNARILDGIDYDGSLHEPWLDPPGYRLNRHLAAKHAASMLRFCELWKDTDRRLWLAAAIGDWDLAHELAQADGNPNLIPFTGERAEECRQLQAEMADRREKAQHVAFCRTRSS